MNPRLVWRYLLRECLGLIITAAALFIPAQTIVWPMAWAVFAILFSWVAVTAWIVIMVNPDLLPLRINRQIHAPRWDFVIVSLLGLLQLLRYILAGIDHRNNNSLHLLLGTQFLALVVLMGGYALFVWAIKSNSYFSQFFQIQSERQHSPVRNGPYGYLRHPGYAGVIIAELATPIVLDSPLALLISILTVILLVIRTALEDHMLQKSLPGYAEYASQVKYRLIYML
jgi:protein-S-isoprenylcysteine O-methyltransferase Ste14